MVQQTGSGQKKKKKKKKKVMAANWNLKVNETTKRKFDFFMSPDFSNTIELQRDVSTKMVQRWQRPRSKKMRIYELYFLKKSILIF